MIKDGLETYTLAPVMVIPVEFPTSNASVLWPKLAPLVLSNVRPETVRAVARLMLMSWTGASLKLRPVMVEDFIPWA